MSKSRTVLNPTDFLNLAIKPYLVRSFHNIYFFTFYAKYLQKFFWSFIYTSTSNALIIVK